MSSTLRPIRRLIRLPLGFPLCRWAPALLVALAGIFSAVGAGATAADWVGLVGVSEPQRPGFLEKRGLKKAAKSLPPEQAEALLERTHYEIWLENTSADKYCTSVRIELRYLSETGAELGRDSFEAAVDLKPHKPATATYLCPDAACRRSAALEVVSVEPVAFREYEERWIKVGDFTWHVEDRWREEGRISLLPFSPGYYDRATFDDSIFGSGDFWIDEAKAFRVEKVPIPASRPYPEHDIAWYSAAGLVVKDGVASKPGIFKAPGRIINTNIHGELPIGQFVRVENAEVWGKKVIGLHLLPICKLSKGQRRLNSWLYFRFDPGVLKSRDTATVEAAIRPFLRPVPLSEVARTCGPRYGTLVHHFSAETDEAQVRRILGEPAASRERGGVVTLTYGAMELHFRNGSLAGADFGG